MVAKNGELNLNDNLILNNKIHSLNMKIEEVTKSDLDNLTKINQINQFEKQIKQLKKDSLTK